MSEGPRLPASNVLSSLMSRAEGAQGPYLPPAARAPKLLTIFGAPALEPDDAAALRHMLSLPPSAYEFGQLSGGFGPAPVFKSKPMPLLFAKHVCKRSCNICKQGRGVCSRPGQPGHLSDERSLPNHNSKQRSASPPSQPPPGRRRRVPKKKKAKVEPLAHVTTSDAKLTDEDGQELFEISHIVAERTRGKMGQREYLVRWKGYAASDNTWEPAASISQLTWVMEDWRVRKQQKAKRKRAQPSNGELSTEEEDAPDSASKARRRAKGPPRKLDTKGDTEVI